MLTPFGGRVHAPWALALGARIRAATGQEAHAIWGDDGIAIHLPDADEAPGAEIALIDPDELEELVLGELGGTALFGARFRENAARALLIPRRRPGQRTPLWQQRLKAQSLLQVARRYGSFPVILETYRECLDDWFDLPSLRAVLGRVRSRELAVVEVETPTASPFAGSLLFEYVASYMYEDDTPAAERRAQALSLDRDLLRELLGQEELRDLIDADALAALEADLQGLSERARARGRRRPARPAAPHRRPVGPGGGAPVGRPLGRTGRGARAGGRAPGLRDPSWAEEERLIAAEDAGRYRDGLGAMPPSGLPETFLQPVPGALRGLVARWARAHGPFHTAEVAERYGLEPRAIDGILAVLETEGALVRGELRPGDPGASGATPRSCAACAAPAWRPCGARSSRPTPGPSGASCPTGSASTAPAPPAASMACARRSPPLQGLALPAAQWEGEVLPRRLADYGPARLDELAARGEIVWVGAGAGGVGGGRVAIYFREDAPLLGPPSADPAPEGEVPDRLRDALAGGASFWDDLLVAGGASREEVFTALWALVWAGEVTNDLWLPLRAPRRLPALTRSGSGSARGRRLGRGRGAPSAVVGRWSLAGRLFRDAPPAGRAAPGAGRAAGRTPRRADPVGDPVRGRAGRLRGGVPGAQRHGDARGLPPGLLRGGPRRRAVRVGRGRRAPARPARSAARRPPARRRARRRGSGPALRRRAAVAAPRGPVAPSRVFGAMVVLVDGRPVVYLERGGRGLLTFASPDDRPLAPALAALAAWILADRRRRAAIERVDGEPVFGSALEAPLATAGFRTDLRAMVLRA